MKPSASRPRGSPKSSNFPVPANQFPAAHEPAPRVPSHPAATRPGAQPTQRRGWSPPPRPGGRATFPPGPAPTPTGSARPSTLSAARHPAGPLPRRGPLHSLCCKAPAGSCRRRPPRRELGPPGSGWARRPGSLVQQPALRRGLPGSRPGLDPGPHRGRLAGSGSA